MDWWWWCRKGLEDSFLVENDLWIDERRGVVLDSQTLKYHEETVTPLGLHADGPFLQAAKRGAHAPVIIRSPPKGFASFEETYEAENLAAKEDWLMDSGDPLDVRIMTAAPEIYGVLDAVRNFHRRGIVFSIGHSIATSDVATEAVRRGVRFIAHLFNPSCTPIVSSPATPVFSGKLEARHAAGKILRLGLHLEKGRVAEADLEFERPFYELILAYNVFPKGAFSSQTSEVHEWRDYKRPGEAKFIDDTESLVGSRLSVVARNACVRSFSCLTGSLLGEAIKCMTFNLARCFWIENRKGTLHAHHMHMIANVGTTGPPSPSRDLTLQLSSPETPVRRLRLSDTDSLHALETEMAETGSWTCEFSFWGPALDSPARWPLSLVFNSPVGLIAFTMKSYVLSILSAVLFVAGVSAQAITLNTPLLDASQGNEVVESYHTSQSSSFSTPAIPANITVGDELVWTLVDSTGATGETAPVKVQAGGSGCSSNSTTTASSGTSTSGSTPATTTPTSTVSVQSKTSTDSVQSKTTPASTSTSTSSSNAAMPIRVPYGVAGILGAVVVAVFA
ncbi:hypothetical protein BC827DRAFT_1155590 [Russula dissimulans]|nr:hypothetical protein BC827DRAFT_1155590 [Russula dissimulans]